MDDNKQKALGVALSQIEKQFGTGSIMRMGDGGTVPDIEVVSTGCAATPLGGEMGTDVSGSVA